MKAILKFLREALGLTRSVESIIRPLTDIINELNVHATEQTAKAEAEAKRIEELRNTVAQREAEVSRARALAKNVGSFANF